MQIGTLLKNADGTLKGHVRSSRRSVNLQLEFIPTSEREGDQSPDYRVLGVGTAGEVFELGAAWKKKMATDQGDREYLSLTMDDPDWTGPLSCAAFPNKKRQNEFDVIWNRPQRAAA